MNKKFICTGCGIDRLCYLETNQENDSSKDIIEDLKCILDNTNQTSFNWKEVSQKKYYISPFRFFYAKNEKLGTDFVKSCYGDNYCQESELYNLTDCLSMISKGYEENKERFKKENIMIDELISNVLKEESDIHM